MDDGMGALLSRAVSSWVARDLPGRTLLARRAGEVAAAAYASGASLGAACRVAHDYVESWRDHPAHGTAARQVDGAASDGRLVGLTG